MYTTTKHSLADTKWGEWNMVTVDKIAEFQTIEDKLAFNSIVMLLVKPSFDGTLSVLNIFSTYPDTAPDGYRVSDMYVIDEQVLAYDLRTAKYNFEDLKLSELHTEVVNNRGVLTGGLIYEREVLEENLPFFKDVEELVSIVDLSEEYKEGIVRQVMSKQI